MKEQLTLGPKGTRALFALAAHAASNGNFAVDGRSIAHMFVRLLEGEGEYRRTRDLPYPQNGAASLKRLADSVAELSSKEST